MEADGSNLSHRAEIFRSKLIEDFQILESTSEQGKRKVPVYNTTDIVDKDIMDRVLIEAPEQMIKFKAYKRGYAVRKTNIAYRLTRVCNQRRLPYGVWSNIVVESSIFQNSLLAITILSSITIGVQGEIPESDSTGISILNMLFDLFDNLTVIIFSIEIILKWLDNFREFWKDAWNIFDLVITLVSVISTILVPFAGSKPSLLAIVAEKLSVFRVLRVLKLVTRLSRLRIVILTVLQTFQSVVFIILLLLIVSYVYSLVGVIIFQSYSQSPRDDLEYHKCFSTIPYTMMTLFQLLTLDQWYNIYQDVVKISDPIVSLLYIVIWIGIGSFIFRNLFVGIMVNNFQSLSAELVRTKETQGKNVELARLKKELSFEILKHNSRLKQARNSILTSSDHEVDTDDSKWTTTNEDKFDQILREEERLSAGWDQTVEEHLTALATNPAETLWPRDTLFRYYQVMEQLQENLEEHDRLHEQIVKCLLEIQRSDT